MNDILDMLKKYNQEHLLKFYDELNDEEKNHLLSQIKSIDFDEMKGLYESIGKKQEVPEVSSMSSFDTKEEYSKVGIESLRNGEYAVVTMAGGQGTRLGHTGPKGTYILEYGINKSLFEIQCDKLKHIYEMSNRYTPWYIMTSGSNHNDTVAFFEENNYFNYPKDKIMFFIQDELPMVNVNGKIIMDSKFNIKMGANGSGGIFSAMLNNGIIEKMKSLGVKYVFIGGIDNILTPYDSSDFLGFTKQNNFPCASYIIPKGYPEERVGVFCKKNGKPSVIEYIHMTSEMNNLKDDNGNLVYGDAHLLLNIFSVEALEEIIDRKLEYVPAFKKAEYINELGELITPDKENSYKFESFIFDAFPFFDEVGLLKGKREEIFAPVKNATGVDSPETASKLYLDFFRK